MSSDHTPDHGSDAAAARRGGRVPFLDLADAVLREAGCPPGTSPASLVGRWEALAAECEGGYGWDYSEYANELRARDLLARLLDDPRLREYPERAGLADEVARVDARFRALLDPDHLLPGDGPWWRRGVLRAAGDAYAEYMRDGYGIPVRPAP